ncbi:hypothetical protein ACEPAF_8621 [Sanghuangporus sanghuang]
MSSRRHPRVTITISTNSEAGYIPPDDRQNKLREEHRQTQPQERYQKLKGIDYGIYWKVYMAKDHETHKLATLREFRDDILKQGDVKSQIEIHT